ncbi:MAG: glucokinase [Acidobacteria bacterium]|nr:glucokinase [Acidobacteriota bacterium]
MILAGDIGGTKTSLALFAVESGRLLRSASTTVASADYPGLAEAVGAFLMSPRPPIEAAAFGVAGPVVNGRVKTTNLPWIVDQQEMTKYLGARVVRLLNDLEAMAWGIEQLDADDLLTLQPGEPSPDGNAALIAAGTGLGEAILFRHDGKLIPSASEGGHADFAPIDAEMDAFLKWLRDQRGHVSVERVASGLGLETIYPFFHDPAAGGSPPHARSSGEIGAAVARAAASGECGGCSRTFGLFLRALGAEAGNLALKAKATAGVYISGGVAYKNLEAMKDGRFLRAFLEKGRFAGFMERIPVHVILDQTTPLLGAALAAARAAGKML